MQIPHMRIHTLMLVFSRVQFSFGAAKAENFTPIIAYIRRGKQSQTVTQLFLYQQLSLVSPWESAC